MKVAVIGSRGLDVKMVDYIPENADMIISGGAHGIDTLAEEYADAHGIPKVIFKPNYKRYGRAATHVRNRKIVKMADMVVAIWDGKSRGTKSTIEYAQKQKKPVCIYIEKKAIEAPKSGSAPDMKRASIKKAGSGQSRGKRA